MGCRYCTEKETDWLEVLLTEECNGKCAWCVEKDGWHPIEHATTATMIAAILASGKKHILLLGGEPTLHPDLPLIMRKLSDAGLKVCLTTNGSQLTQEYVHEVFFGGPDVNISIHSHDLKKNEEVTGICLDDEKLSWAIYHILNNGGKVRLNCNCIAGYVDTRQAILDYVGFAKRHGAGSVRFAELFGNTGLFVNLAAITDPGLINMPWGDGIDCGLTDHPWRDGCVHKTTIDGMPVYFKQLCGFQTSMRPRPKDDPAKIVRRDVLYYDGKMYKGWQRKESDMSCATPDGRPVTRTEFNVLMEKLEQISETLRVLKVAVPEVGYSAPAQEASPAGYAPCHY